jgi:outer membrane protein TolC
VELERGGRTDVSSVRQTEARRSQAEANLATARGDLADALAAYEQVVGVRADEVALAAAGSALDPAPRAPSGGAEAAAAEAAVGSPTVLIATSDVDVAAADLRGAGAVYYPRVDAEFAATTNRDVSGVEGGDTTASALLVLRYNLYRGGADIAREREATQRLGAARSRLEQARREGHPSCGARPQPSPTRGSSRSRPEGRSRRPHARRDATRRDATRSGVGSANSSPAGAWPQRCRAWSGRSRGRGQRS